MRWKIIILIYLRIIEINLVCSQVNINQGLISNYYFNGNANDSTSNGYHGIVQGAQLTTDRFGNCNNAYLFTNYLQLIQLPHQIINNRSDFTMTVWINLTALNSSILTAANNSIENEYFPYVMGNGNIRQHVKNNSTTGNESIPLNTWIHLAFTRNGNTGSVSTYVNGTLTHTGNQQSGLFNVSPNGLYLGNDQDCLGGCWDSNNQFRGKMDDIRFYNRILNVNEIIAIKNLPNFFPPLSTPVISSDTIFTCSFPRIINSLPGFINYVWNNNQTSQNINVFQPGTYSVAATLPNGCIVYDTVDVIFFQPQLNLILQDSIETCSFPFTINPISGLISYLWNNNSTNQNFTVNQPGLYTLTAIDANGCIYHDTIKVIPGTLIQNLIQNDTIKTCMFPLTINALPSLSSYLWSNNSSSQSTIVSQFGIYTLQATNSINCKIYDTVHVVQNFPIIELVTADTIKTCSFPINISANSNMFNYSWSNGGNTFQNVINQSGNYFVNAQDQNGCLIYDSIIVIQDQIFLNFLNEDSIIGCDSVILFVQTNLNSNQIIWNNGDIGLTNYADSTGWYIITGLTNCPNNTDSLFVKIFKSPIINLSDNLVICNDNLIIYDKDSIGISTNFYLWSNGDLTPSTTIYDEGNYFIKKSNNCGTDSISFFVKKFERKNFSDTALCLGQSLRFDFNNSYDSVKWNSKKSLIYEIKNSGNFKVELFYKNCLHKDSFTVELINNSKVFETNPVTINICKDSLIEITPISLFEKYLWFDNDTSSSKIFYNSGKYILTAQKKHCKITDTLKLVFNQIKIPKLDIPNNLCLGDEFYIDLDNVEHLTYYKYSDNYDKDTRLFHDDSELKLTLSNSCFNNEIDLKLNFNDCECDRIFIPNAFTPNNNNLFNDVWKPIFNCAILNYNLEIFNKWGQLIFSTSDINLGWDGKYKGEICQNDAYAYLISYSYKNKSKIFTLTKNGLIYIVN